MRWFAILILLLPVVISASDQDAVPIVIGESVTMTSEILGEERRILVSKPAGYDQSAVRYPVMYLLDGDSHFHHTTGIIQFLSSIGSMPEMLVVAIPNTQRTRDLTPVTSDTSNRFQGAGGADDFLLFVTDELREFIESRYRTQPYNMLVGHSFGGLFAIHALMSNPDAFDAYVAISPSLWWDTQRLIDEALPFYTERPGLRKFLFITLGNEGGGMLPAVQAYAQVLKKHAPKDLEWEFQHMENETHGSIPHRTTYNALEKLYKDWSLPVQIAQAGTLEDFDAHYVSLSKKFGYEIITPELLVNQLGYRLIGQKLYDEAIRVLKRNVQVYPESANVYDSLGDAYDAAGNSKLALQNYEIAYHKGRHANHPNLQVYKNNFERLQKKVEDK